MFAFVSMVISNVGLDMILQYSVPVFECHLSYGDSSDHSGAGPSVDGQIQKYLSLDSCFMWSQQCIYCAGSEWDHHSGITAVIKMLPAYEAGFGWLLPTFVGAAGQEYLTDLIKKQTV